MDQLMDTHKDGHKYLHSDQGSLPGEHPGRARNPVIKVADIAWLEFEKPDLTRTEAFARAFGFQTAQRARRPRTFSEPTRNRCATNWFR